jgi:hypothetical protein
MNLAKYDILEVNAELLKIGTEKNEQEKKKKGKGKKTGAASKKRNKK